jgi:hypothetical protein
MLEYADVFDLSDPYSFAENGHEARHWVCDGRCNGQGSLDNICDGISVRER